MLKSIWISHLHYNLHEYKVYDSHFKLFKPKKAWNIIHHPILILGDVISPSVINFLEDFQDSNFGRPIFLI